LLAYPFDATFRSFEGARGWDAASRSFVRLHRMPGWRRGKARMRLHFGCLAVR
jgi:hypothetical protein